MVNFNKVGMLLLSNDETRFLVCQKNHFTSKFIMPGGRFEKCENDEECLTREIKEELDVDIDITSLKFIGQYQDVAAGDPNKDVVIRLYKGKVVGEPKPTNEIIRFHWISKDDVSNPLVSPIIKNKIIPDLIKRKILKNIRGIRKSK